MDSSSEKKIGITSKDESSPPGGPAVDMDHVVGILAFRSAAFDNQDSCTHLNLLKVEDG